MFGRRIAQNLTELQRLGITHILNAAHSKRGSIGDQKFYGRSFVYCGIPADDSTHFDLDVYFRPAAEFIHKGLKAVDGEISYRSRGGANLHIVQTGFDSRTCMCPVV